MHRAATASPHRATETATIAMVLCPSFTALDLMGPHHVFSMIEGSQVLLVAETIDPVTSDTGHSVLPTATFETCPESPRPSG